MGEVIGQILPFAIGIALSPLPIVAVILMLFTKRARSNGLAFLLGWLLGLLVVGGVVLALTNAGRIALGESTESTLSAVLKLVLGALLMFGALRQWQGRPIEGEEASMPKWMAAIDSFTTGRALGLAALLSGVNPKNLALNLAAATAIAGAGLTNSQQAVALIVFVILASLSIAAPVVYYLVAGTSAEKTLTGWKTWLIANNGAVMAVLFLIFGVKLIGDSLGVLFP